MITLNERKAPGPERILAKLLQMVAPEPKIGAICAVIKLDWAVKKSKLGSVKQ